MFSVLQLRSFRCLSWLLVLAALFVSPLPRALAQEASSGISGTIVDNMGAAVAGAQVSARNTNTNFTLTSRTNASGYYEFPNLPAGQYVVSVSAATFNPTKSSPFTIETGQGARIDLSLKVGAVDVTVDVSAAATLINTTTNDLGVTIDAKQIENLPVQNRNLFDLLALQPGVNADQNGDAGSTGQNARGGFEVNGAPGLANSILLDGVDATFGEDNGAGAGNNSPINTVGLGAIGEFRTSSSVPPVEFGRAVGGVLSITTKSGTNKFHGNVFEFFRNDVMDANAWANKNATPIVPRSELRFNEFGGNLGGPILRDRMFFFANYEGSRVVQGTPNKTRVPTPLVIGKVKNPLIVQEITKLPLPNNSYTSTATTGYWTGNLNTNTMEDTGLIRVDTSLANHRLMVRFDLNNQNQAAQQLRPDNQLVYPLRFYNSAVEDVWTVTPNLVNELRFGLNRNDLARHNTTYDSDPFRNYITVTSLFNSDSAQSQLHFLTTTYTLVDNVTWVHGRHSFNFGTDNRRLRSVRYQDTNNVSTYANTTSLYSDKPTSVQVTFGSEKSIDSYQLSFYAQDSFRASRRLTLNYGIRYEYYTPFHGAFNIRNSDPFSNLSSNKGDPFFSEGKFSFAPRVGLIDDLFGNQKLVFRAGFGLMFIPPQPFFMYDSAFLDPRLPFNATLTSADVPSSFSLTFPVSKDLVNYYTANPDQLPSGLNLGRQVSNYHHADQYSINWNANLQYQARRDLMVGLTYTALRDQHSPTLTLPNQFEPGACPTTSTCTARPNPNFGEIKYNIFDGREYYDGMYAQVRYRHGPNRADFYYTWASSITYWSGSNNIGTGQSDVQDLDNPAGSRGPGTGSSRNRMVVSYTFTNRAPGFAKSHAFLRGALGGYSLQGILRYNTGIAVNVQANQDLVRNNRYASSARPDRVIGQPLYLHTKLADGTPQYLNPAAFDGNTPFAEHRYGTLGYNAIYGPHQVNFNASLIKSIRFYQNKDIRLRVEGFNVFNHPNMSNPVLTRTSSDFGQIITRRTPRYVQLGAEVRF